MAKAEAAAIIANIGVRVIVLKMGVNGLEAFHENASVFQPAIPAVMVRDRTGAGDVAAAGFLAVLIKNLTLERSLELAALAAS